MAAALPRYRLLRQNTSGNWALCGAGEVPDAINPLDLNNTALATDGFVAAGSLLNGGCTRTMVASLAILAGQDVYPAANGKITNLVTGTKLGIAREAATADGDEIEVEERPSLNDWRAKIVGPSSNIAATAADTAYDRSITVGANVCKIGSRGRIRAKVDVSATTGAETLLLQLKVYDGTNTVVLGATAAIDVANSDIGVIDVEFEMRTATQVVAAGVAGLGVPVTATMRPTGVALSTLDPTAAWTITVTQTASSTGETSALSMLSVDITR
jgi:hypothetical protein